MNQNHVAKIRCVQKKSLRREHDKYDANFNLQTRNLMGTRPDGCEYEWRFWLRVHPYLIQSFAGVGFYFNPRVTRTRPEFSSFFVLRKNN